MAISQETLRLAAELRRSLSLVTDAHARTLVQAWARAWDVTAPALLAGIDEVLAAAEGGQWPGRGAILRNQRLMHALEYALAQLKVLVRDAGATITSDLDDVTSVAARAQSMLIASQLPLEGRTVAELAVRFGRLDPLALQAIVERTSRQVTSLTWPLSEKAYDAMLRELIRGVTVGDNPRTTAQQILKRAEGEFNGGLNRALTVARTEVIDAHRSAAAMAQTANNDVLQGWMWHAHMDRRTCPSCWSRHGTVHSGDTPGPWDHQQGRCSRMPITKTWRELGFDIDEPPSLVPDAETVFRSMSRADQLAVMGPARLAALDDGRARWQDLSKLRTAPGWRDSYAPRPVREFAA